MRIFYFKTYVAGLLFVALQLFGFANAQTINASFKLGNSFLVSDAPVSSEMFQSTAVEVNYKKNLFAILYSGQNYIGSANEYVVYQDLYNNLLTRINSFALSYEFILLQKEKYYLSLGATGGIGQMRVNTNLYDLNNMPYDVIDGEIVSNSGNNVYLDDDYETNLLELDPFNLSSFSSDYYFAGPSTKFQFNLTPDLSMHLSSLFRFTSTDLIDYAKENKNDHQLDLMLGISFNLYKKQIKEEVEGQEELIENEEIISPNKKFKLNISSIQLEEVQQLNVESVVESEIDTEENLETVSPSFEREELIVEEEPDQFTGFTEVMETQENISDMLTDEISQINDSIDVLNIENEQENFTEEAVDSFEEGTYFLIAGVYSERSNLESAASILKIKASQYIIRNNLYYLYISSSNEKMDLVQLQNTMEIESWIYKDIF